MSWQDEVKDGKRFEFGANWQSFLDTLDDEKIAAAKNELYKWLGDISGKRFLDIGSGSGIHSLAARASGAKVYSFDYDKQSVECTKQLKQRYFKDDSNWTIEQGSALDLDYIKSLGTFDIVYSWGVLHHTGDMLTALENAAIPLNSRGGGGSLFIAIYNDQGLQSSFWKKFKKLYVGSNPLIQRILLYSTIIYFELGKAVKRLLSGQNPLSFKHWQEYKKQRGMSPMHDYIDWAGGYPFEVAKPETIFDFYKERGFALEKLLTCGGKLGCNQFLFVKRD